MQNQAKEKILIPEGCFEGDCYSCFYAKSKSMQSNGSMFCREGNRYVFPNDQYGCPSYCWRIKEWIKIALFTYFVVAIMVGIITLLF